MVKEVDLIRKRLGQPMAITPNTLMLNQTVKN